MQGVLETPETGEVMKGDMKVYYVDSMELKEYPSGPRDVAMVYKAKAEIEIERIQNEFDELKAAMKENCADVVQVEDEEDE